MTDNIYGPLIQLIGTWQGNKGIDISPETNGFETNLYHETITFTAVGNVTNAESQKLATIHYRQIVRKKSDNQVFHDETGYWIWDEKEKIIIHSFTIPRGVCILAGGSYNQKNESNHSIELNVMASVNDEKWKIIQSPFMQKKATTKKYTQCMKVTGDQLSYSQTIFIDIYGKSFEHTDENKLTRTHDNQPHT